MICFEIFYNIFLHDTANTNHFMCETVKVDKNLLFFSNELNMSCACVLS